MADWQNDLERYRMGKMTPTEMHAFEKRALQDPFLADALEGAEQVAPEDFAQDLQELTAKLTSKEKVGIPASQVSPADVQSTKPWVWPLRIAASVLLLVGMFWIGNQLIPEDSNQLVLNNESVPSVKEEPSLPKKANQDSAEIEQTQQPASPLKQTVSGLAIENDNNNTRSKEKAANETMASSRPSSGEVESAPVPEAKPTADQNFAYKLEDKTLAQSEQRADAEKLSLLKRSIELASPSSNAVRTDSMASKFIRGLVTSLEDGTPLPGVNVVVKGTQVGTVTNMDGFFQLPNVSPNQKLVFSFIGLQSKEIEVKQPQLNVTLAPDVSQLSEVVVTGVRTDDSDHAPITKLAMPEGGLKAYDAYLDNNLQYPKEALAKRVKGKVAIRFTVRVDGTLDEFEVVKSLGSGCDEEVIRLVKEGPEWTATTEDDVPVESEVLVKVKFDPAKAKK